LTRPAGLISIGTNSTRALVAQLEPKPSTLLARSIGTRIGEGLRESGALQEGAMHRTLDAIAELVKAVHELSSDIRVIATSALRRANNAEEFAARVKAVTGAALDIVSAEEEARCSYAGAISGLPVDATYGVLDVGGGSTEYAIDNAYVSCEIGAVRLTERFPSLQGTASSDELREAREAARVELQPVRSMKAVDQLVAVGGSATTACAVIAGERSEKPYVRLERDRLGSLIDLLASLPLERRKQLPAMPAQRADILLAGALLLDEACAAAGHSKAIVSTNDLLLGYLIRH
jgi:exopolyphosphatase/guanosine-5'-triphosphate,3'-diphosphate pyrophosphatase